MISAEIWDKQGELGSCDNVKVIKQIQVDAFKYGMTFAATIAGNVCPTIIYAGGCISAQYEIQIARNNLIEIPTLNEN